MAGVKISTIITAISNLSVTLTNGNALVIKDDSEIPESVLRLGGVLFPNPDNFISDVSAEPVTYGIDGVERMDVRYTLSYLFHDMPIGSNRSIGDNLDMVIRDLALILNAILTNDTISDGCELRLGEVPYIGALSDPSGNQFYGTEIKLNVLEFYEV